MSRSEKALRDFDRLLRDLVHGIDRAPIEEQVDAGFAVQVMVASARKAMERIKGRLRATAASRFHGGTSISIEGRDAVALISAPEPIVRMVKDANVKALKRALGDDFAEFFHEHTEVHPKSGALSRVLELPPDVQRLIFASIEQDIGAGGVGFNHRRKP